MYITTQISTKEEQFKEFLEGFPLKKSSSRENEDNQSLKNWINHAHDEEQRKKNLQKDYDTLKREHENLKKAHQILKEKVEILTATGTTKSKQKI